MAEPNATAQILALADVADAARDGLTKAKGAKYSDAERKAFDGARRLADALRQSIDPNNRTAPGKIQAEVNLLQNALKGLDQKYQKYVKAAIGAGKTALSIVAPGPSTGAEGAALDADRLREIIPPEYGRLRGLVASIAAAIRTGNPIALQRSIADITQARAGFADGSAEQAIADAALSLEGLQPEAVGMDAATLEQERVEATGYLDAMKPYADRLHSDPVLRSLAAHVRVLIWRISRNPSDAAGWKAQLKTRIDQIEAELDQAVKQRRGRSETDSLTGVKVYAKSAAEMRDDGAAVRYIQKPGGVHGQPLTQMVSTPYQTPLEDALDRLDAYRRRFQSLRFP